jgi:signal transduction histidine kinase
VIAILECHLPHHAGSGANELSLEDADIAPLLIEARAEDQAAITTAVREAVIGLREFVIDFRGRDPLGERRWFEIHGDVQRDVRTGDLVIRGVTLDVTWRRAIDDTQRQRLQADEVTQWAGRVVHDFNNLLTVIMGHAFLLRQAIDPASPLTESIDAIAAEVERGSALTRRVQWLRGAPGSLRADVR